ncbi:unnamed protein product, partial [Meganyctiphanes norvegica]
MPTNTVVRLDKTGTFLYSAHYTLSICGDVEFKVYPIRYVILILFVMYSMSNAFQWIQYSIIANIIVDYYDVKFGMVDWLSMIYMVSYIPLIFPASWFLQAKGMIQ